MDAHTERIKDHGRKKDMYDKFGEFDSWEEINKAAAGLKEEGDEKSLVALAIENGIDKEDAEDYIDGAVDKLCNPLIAALGKIAVEEKELKAKDIMEDWVNYIRTLCSEDENIALGVRKKDKNLKGCIGQLLSWSFKHQQNVDKDIIKAAGISANKVTLGIPGIRTAHQLIKEYYGGAR